MQKKWFQLLAKKKKTTEQKEQIVQFMSSKFFKSLITPLPVDKLIGNIELKQWPAQTVLFQESEKIQSFYFLLEGSINLYKKVHKKGHDSALQIVKCVNQPSLFSDSYFINSSHRNYTAITNDNNSGCKGFILTKSVLQEHCSYLMKQYKILKTYLCDFVNLSSDRFYKINLYESVELKTFPYGRSIGIENQIYIIYSGECLMNFQEKQSREQTKSVAYKTKINNPNLYRPLVKLCQNECFGMQLIYGQNIKYPNCRKFKYVVTSQNLMCISISVSNLSLFPKQISEKLKFIHRSHINKLQQNLYFQNFRNPAYQNQKFSMSKSLSPGLVGARSPKKIEQRKYTQIYMIQDKNKKPNFTQVQVNKGQVFRNKKGISRLQLPNLQSKSMKHGQQKESSFIRLNQTLNASNSVPSLCEGRITPKNIVQIRRIFCLGFDLKNRCDKESYHMNKKSIQKQVIKQPKGYFPFTKNKQTNKQNSSNSVQRAQRKSSHSEHKQWSCYLKLPKIDKSGFA